ncbi:MAG TPA: glycosyltransferase, partial [Acidimicrobiales bacterium]|nr:glycosyltransferase [Acidimicrobiales bacterium]
GLGGGRSGEDPQRVEREARRVGEVRDLHLVRAERRRQERDLLADDLAKAMPFVGSRLGDQSGQVLGIGIDAGTQAPVRLNLTDWTSRDISASIGLFAELGAGKSVTLKKILADVAADGGLEVIVVDDGSGDDTAQLALEAGAEQVVVQPRNRGKGAAVRAGMLASRGRVVAFTDADLAYDPPQLRRALEAVEAGWDVVIGNRRHVDSDVARATGLRALGSRVVNRLSAAVLLAAPRDTQCGLKAFRGDVARRLFAHTRVDGFAFDIEVLHLVERAELALGEIPVRLDETGASSTVRVGRDIVQLVVDLLRVRRWSSTGAYDDVVVPRVTSGGPR